MATKPTKKQGKSTKLSRAVGQEVRNLRAKYEAETNPSEKQRLGEILALTLHSGEVFDDPMNQGQTVKPIAKPKLF